MRKRRENNEDTKETSDSLWSDLEHAKAAVLNSLTSASGQRTYEHAIREFVGWDCSEPRLAFNRTVVLRYRMHLEQRHDAPATINLRLAAVRRLAYEAADARSDSVPPRPRFDSDDGTLPGMQTEAAVCRQRSAGDRARFCGVSHLSRGGSAEDPPLATREEQSVEGEPPQRAGRKLVRGHEAL